MFKTNSVYDAIYAIIMTNLNYAKSNVYNKLSFFDITIKMFIEYYIIYIIIFLSLISMIIIKFNNYFKISIISSFLIGIIYITFSKRLHVYYFVILCPYFLSIFFLFLIKKEKVLSFKSIKIFHYIVTMLIILLLNIFINRNIDVQVINQVHRAERINNVIEQKFKEKDNIKLLSMGFFPEAYVYTKLDCPYKFWFIPSLSYKVDKTIFMSQYKYLLNNDNDMVIMRMSNLISEYPEQIRLQINFILSNDYELVDTIRTNEFFGDINIYVKK